MISLELGVEDLAKYPFLEKTGEYIRQRGLSLEDFSQPDLSKVIGRAKKRILQARSWSREVSVELDYPDVEILSFPLALMLVKATKLDHLISCYSLAEAVRVEKLLESEREELVVQIFRNVLKIDLSPVSERKEVFPLLNYKVTVMEYLKRATHFHQLEWKLVNRVVDQGYVYLRTHELIRLIRQEIDDMIRERLKDLAVPRLPENLEKTVRDIAMLSPPPMKMSD
ncbi:MAG: hypothetical protein V3W09_05565, partial [Nitrososphaerales archaeon]